jgi:hypothetical protein
MTKQLRYGIEIRTERQHHGRECVPAHMESDRHCKEKRRGED